MGGTPDEIKVHQNNIVHGIGCNIGCDIGFFYFLPCCWRYDIAYDIVANYYIVYDIVPNQAKIHFLALQCNFLSRYPTGYREFFTF
jgi:hypothetical protein